MRTDPAVYIVTDIETDGGVLGVHSMIAFASVAIRADGTVLGEFEAVLEPLEGATTDPDTMRWWAAHPESLAAARRNAQPAEAVMRRFASWVKQYPNAVFAAHPIIFDGTWMNFYLRRFTPYGVTQGLHETDRLFGTFGLCLRSFGAALLGIPADQCSPDVYPADWLGHHPHTHRAIDDARGYACLLAKLFAVSRARATPA